MLFYFILFHSSKYYTGQNKIKHIKQHVLTKRYIFMHKHYVIYFFESYSSNERNKSANSFNMTMMNLTSFCQWWKRPLLHHMYRMKKVIIKIHIQGRRTDMKYWGQQKYPWVQEACSPLHVWQASVSRILPLSLSCSFFMPSTLSFTVLHLGPFIQLRNSSRNCERESVYIHSKLVIARKLLPHYTL